MGRKSDYSIKNEDEKQEVFRKEALDKFSKEAVTPKEFALICENNFPKMTFDEKTIRNNIRKFCNGKFNTVYEKNFKDVKGNYSIPPEIQPAFMTLIAFSMIDGRKRYNDFTKEKYIGIIDAIDKYFDADEKKALQMIPLYDASIAEYQFMKTMSKDLSQLLTYVSESQPTIRRFLLNKVSKKIKKLTKKMKKKSNRAWTSRHVFGTDDPEAITIREQNSQDDIVENLFFSRKWREVFSSLIRVNLNNINSENKDNCEKLSIRLYRISQRYQATLKEKNKFDNANENTQALIEGCDNSQEYERISNKIRGVLDTNNVIEKDIIYLIDEYFDKIKIIERESNKNYVKFLEYLQGSYDKEERTLEDALEVIRRFCKIEDDLVDITNQPNLFTKLE